MATTPDRFLPPDPKRREPYRFTPQLAVRVGIFATLATAVFAILIFRLWAVQVISGDDYRRDARENQVRTFRLAAPRGPILDRNGQPLVTNVAGTVVELWPAYVPEGQVGAIVQKLSALLDVSSRTLRGAIREHGSDPLTPVVVKVNVHETKANYLLEHQSEFPGVRLAQRQLRRYADGVLGAQLLGYVGEISAEELEELGSSYRGGDRIGKTGVEAAYDAYLRGRPGIGEAQVNALGELRSGLTPSRLPRAGYALRLTIDADVQRAAEDGLAFGIRLARANGDWAADGGAVVALSPLNGEVIAIASKPTFDPSIFNAGDPRKLQALNDPEANSPLLDRAAAGLYPPGSTFKPVTALAALAEGLASTSEELPCVPEMTINRQRFVNWDPYRNEPMTLSTALAASCDTYFYELGLRLYRDQGTPLQDWARQFGFEKATGVELGAEEKGLVPTPAWRRRTFKTEIDKIWKPGDSVQLAIGQGDVLVTPIQMARFYAALANGGQLVYPHLAQDVEQPGSGDEQPVVLRSFAGRPPRTLGLSSSAIQVVNDGLWRATHDATYGTSYHVFGNYPVPIAGKTGTAEKYMTFADGTGKLMSQAWWCGWGPYGQDAWNGKPPLVVCVLVENGGHGGAVAAPVALRVFEAYFGVKATTPVGAGNSD